MIIQFPQRHAHDRASTGSRAASATIISAVTPAPLATAESRIACHHSSGIRSRCDHLRAAAMPAPISIAMASGEPQSPMIERNEVGAPGSIMDACLGQFVLNGKAKVSRDYEPPNSDNRGMADRTSETAETLAFIARVRSAREAKFRTQRPVYSFLGIPQDQYKHYELTRPLPRRFIPKFCLITERSMEWLLTGEEKGSLVSPEMPEQAAERRPRRRRKAA